MSAIMSEPIARSETRSIALSIVEVEQPAEISSYDVFQRVGELTRKLHDALRELGYDQAVESAVSALPDARARLGYIATLTGQAAERVLSAAETGKEFQSRIESGASALLAQWDAGAAREETEQRTREFLAEVKQDAAKSNELLTDIILAQDFHDLTGQVLNKVVALAQSLEEQLLHLLLEATPPEQRARLVEQPGLDGPVVDATGRDDVVTNQAQVDDLLESLGF